MRDEQDYYDYFPDQLGLGGQAPPPDTSSSGGWGLPPGPPRDGYYWNLVDGQWVETPIYGGGYGNFAPPPTPTPTPPPTPTPTPYPTTTYYPPPSGGGQNFNGNFAWPRFSAPVFQGIAPMEAPPPFAYQPFAYDEFKAPDFKQIYDDPSYAGRRDEGLRAIEHGAAAQGLTRLPETLKSLAGWNQDFASREYGNIFDRSANVYDRNRANAFGTWKSNRDNAADNYSLNYGISRDIWDRNEKQNLDAYDRNYKAAYDQFDFNEWRPAQMTFNDMYNRWKTTVEAGAN